MGKKSDGVELAFLTPLLKDGAKSVSGGITIDDEGFIKTWLTKDGGGADGVDEGIKGGFVFVFPMELAPFCTMGNEHIEWGGEHTEIANIHAVEVEKP